MHNIKANQLAQFHFHWQKWRECKKQSSEIYTLFCSGLQCKPVYHSIIPHLCPTPHLYHTWLFPALPGSLNGKSKQNIVLQQILLFSTGCWASNYSLLLLVTRGPHVFIHPPQAIQGKKCTKMIKKINIYKKC